MSLLSKFSRAVKTSRLSVRTFSAASPHAHEKIDWDTEYFARTPPKPERQEWNGYSWNWIKESGPLKSNTVVVFTHRMLLDHTQWDPVVEKLNKKYRCLQWDLRRHGKSAQTTEVKRYTEMAHDIKVILDQWTLGKPKHVVFVGEELGGWISSYLRKMQTVDFFQQSNFTVDGLVMINAGFNYWRPADRLQIELIISQWRKFGFTPEVANLLAKFHFGKPVTDPLVAPWLEKWKQMDGEDLHMFYRYLTSMRYGYYNTEKELIAFPCPTLLIRGTQDRNLTDKHILDFQENCAYDLYDEHYPRKVVEIEGGKVLSLTNPGELANQLEEFLSTLSLDLSDNHTPRISPYLH